MTTIDTKALALSLPDLVYEALRFANFAAGQGFCAPEDQKLARDPDLLLSEYTDRSGDDDWDTLPERARDALAAFLREAASPWRPINDEARQANRILIAWAPFGNIHEHVELGRWSYHARAWVNTYGKPFTGDPDVWMPLPIFALPTPPAAGGGGAE